MDKIKRNNRKFVMVQSSDDEKGRYQLYAELDGHMHLASWFRWLAAQRMVKLAEGKHRTGIYEKKRRGY